MMNFIEKFRRNWPVWLVSSLTIYTSLAALVYFFWRLTPLLAVVCFIFASIITYILDYFGLFFNESEKTVDNDQIDIYFGLNSLFFLGITLLLFSKRATISLVSPWEVIPSYFFALYFLFALTLLLQKKIHSYSLYFFVFLNLAIIVIIYQLGYGYDFFVHQATLKKIIETGLILPKTPYYLGQYALLYLANLVVPQLSFFLHLWLVPGLAILLLPWLALRLQLERRAVVILAILTAPFLCFSTPQNLGLLLLLAESICLLKPSKTNLTLAGLFTLANLTIHPLSGVPALALLLIALMQNHQRKKLATIFGSSLPLLLPIALLATHLATLKSTSNIFLNFWPNNFRLPQSENIWLNLTYTFDSNLPIITLALLLAGIFIKRGKNYFQGQLGLALGLLITAYIMRFLDIKGVIDYEQADFAKRLIVAALIILLPFFLATTSWFTQQLQNLRRSEQIIWYSFLALCLTGSFYLNYPRHDNYFNSRGLSVSQADLSAVHFIETDAQGQPYIVLANQQVSAAALSAYGFAHYYQSNFYYPIPTTNPLYDYYQQMVYQVPSQKTAESAMALAGVQRCYFVLNSYWQDFPKVLEQAKLSTPTYKNFDNQVYVFEYNKH
jgi:hypothetical protein